MLKHEGSTLLGILALLLVNCCTSWSQDIADGRTVIEKGVHIAEENRVYSTPVVFKDGARIDIGPEVTVTFLKGIIADQDAHIFGGEGRIAGVKRVVPEWFGAVGDGVVDDTVALQRALNSCETPRLPSGAFGEGCAGRGVQLLLRKVYLVTLLDATADFLNIHAENAWLVAMKEGKFPYLLGIFRQAITITGNLCIEGNYNQGYGDMIHVNSRNLISHNVRVFRASLAWFFGNPNWPISGVPGDAELGDSEILIFGGATIWCQRAVELVGANTIVRFSTWPGIQTAKH